MGMTLSPIPAMILIRHQCSKPQRAMSSETELSPQEEYESDQNRNGNLLNSVLMIFPERAASTNQRSRDASAQESRRRLEERIESVLKDTNSPTLSFWEPVEPSIALQAYSGMGVSALALSHDNPSRAENGMISESRTFRPAPAAGFRHCGRVTAEPENHSLCFPHVPGRPCPFTTCAARYIPSTRSALNISSAGFRCDSTRPNQ